MDEEKRALRFEEHFIVCPIKGGTRCAACCVYFDRYKGCRRHCASLNKHLKANPTLMEAVTQYYEEKKKEKVKGSGNDFFGQFLPDLELTCPYCKFIGKSPRGLRIHLRRTHNRIITKET